MAAEGYTAQHVCTGHPPHAIKRTCGCYGAPQVSKCRRLRNEEGGRLAPPYGNVSLFVTTGELAARGAGRAGGTRAGSCLGALADGGKEGRAR